MINQKFRRAVPLDAEMLINAINIRDQVSVDHMFSEKETPVLCSHREYSYGTKISFVMAFVKHVLQWTGLLECI